MRQGALMIRPISWRIAIRGLTGIAFFWLVLILILRWRFPELFTVSNHADQIRHDSILTRALLAATISLSIFAAFLPPALLWGEYRLLRLQLSTDEPRRVWIDAIWYAGYLLFLILFLRAW